MNRNTRGFTLIEIMIVVAIVAILAAVAYPSYQESVRRAARADAQSGMMEIAQNAERFFTQQNQYAATRAGLPYVLPFNQSPLGGAARYNFNIAFPTPQTFVLQAVPTPVQAADACGNLTINQLGVTGPALGTDGRPCW